VGCGRRQTADRSLPVHSVNGLPFGLHWRFLE
jgi:hypothetical protein